MGEDLQVEPLQTAAEAFWDINVGKHREPFVHWESPEPIQQKLNSLVTGSQNLHPPGWFVQKYGPFDTVAELGCGDGVLAQYLATSYPMKSLTAYDFSQASLDASKQLCTGLDICTFQKIDLNKEALPIANYDAVFTTGTMHHIEALDFCFASIAKSLKSSGLLWLNDYVGPDRFQWSDTQMRLADELLAQIPIKWRLKDHVERCDAKALAEMDPSEAVAPSKIEDALFAHFDVLKTFQRGGTLLAPIFGSSCLSREMADSNEGHDTLRRLFDEEQRLISSGIIKSTHNMYIARPRHTEIF
ncbi:class I SAM-dependent methyltransferase [Bradyrhizobium sp. 33ap4]|uniref:class I SAM-dependent methyltransferase n=1 Tax=Bradyrhizobium sp. 33ap4 TaxID=3061630 RepID=UPI00292E028C|nr:class I SAM-dependent methyltransferase [Bradyrhizobium sp. 33ap4]